MLGYSLDHTYTLNQCGFDDLKGRDRVVATVIRDAKGEDGRPLFDARLVVFSLSVLSHAGEYNDGGFEVVAVMDQDGEKVAKAEWKDLMYVGEDGLFRTFEDLSEAQQAKVNDDSVIFDPDDIGIGWFDVVYYYVSTRLVRGKDKMKFGDAGNEAGGVFRYYRSAALVFKPAKSDDSSSSDDDGSGDAE